MRKTKYVGFLALLGAFAVSFSLCASSAMAETSPKIASDSITYYENANGPKIGTVSRKIIEKDGLYFKDIDGSGEFKTYDDWRLSPKERADAYVKTLTVDEKLAQLFISSWRLGKYPEPARYKGHTIVQDATGIFDEAPVTSIGIPGTTELIKGWFNRHLILRSHPTPNDLADWINQLNAVAEECEHFIPVIIASNSRNENDQPVFKMGDAVGSFVRWPSTLGIAAAVKGDSIDLIDKFADCIRREWNSAGMKKGYMYMADVVSDPRWQRTYGTYGEDPELIAEIFSHIIPIVQGSPNGVTPEGVAMTAKHFPGGGARENGFDPHYKMGQWNVYQTEGSLQKYHLPAFKAAVKANVSSIMPYYAKPSAEKSATQLDENGEPMEMRPFGFAYNKPFIDGLLRNQLGFKGYVNSDTGILHERDWGVETLDVAEKIGFAVNQSGVDLISGNMYDNADARIAYDRATNGYYNTHPVPDGYAAEDLVLTDETLDRAVSRTLVEMFALGLFENPYRDPKAAVEVFASESDRANALDVHRKSVVLLKNDAALPLTSEKLEGKKVYARAFGKDAKSGEATTEKLKTSLADSVTLTDDPAAADYAILLLVPSSGSYFSATPGYLELSICENKIVPTVDEMGRPTAETHTETTLTGVADIANIAKAVHANGGKVIANVNFTLSWDLGNVEPYCDALLAGFDTCVSATLDVIFGRFAPKGKLPLTLPRGDAVLAVNANGVCISPNDVPGYDKDKYMPDSLKDENGKAYAYRDGAGNYYEMNFGLTY